jgi:large subunit ribosomal protein L13
MATEIANRLRGKHKAEFTPHVDTGDYIVVVNAEKIRVTGNKAADKTYYHHTGFPGGIKSITFDKLIDKAPERVIQMAVKGMMPKNKLSYSMLGKLKVYAGSEHPHTAQQPQVLDI